jgi:uncharacterized membrane protein
MIEAVLFAAVFAAALGSGLIAGVFFAFSTFVMAALGKLPAAHGIAAMQSINIVVINRIFLSVFVGTAALCVAIAAMTVLRWSGQSAAYQLAGAVFYVVGTFLVTMRFNVPHNDALAATKPDSAEGAALWSRYLREWTLWNHVRTAAALAAMAMFILALR